MPRATLIVEVDEPAEVDAIASWFVRWGAQISHRSENLGCGCCVDIWEVEAPAQALSELPPKCYAGDEWTSEGPPAPKRPIEVFTLGVVASLVLSALFFWVWYERYLRIEFNELGRSYDAKSQVVSTDAAFVWCLPAFGFLLLAAIMVIYRFLRSGKPA